MPLPVWLQSLALVMPWEMHQRVSALEADMLTAYNQIGLLEERMAQHGLLDPAPAPEPEPPAA